MNDKELLTKFAETKSEAAFRALVERHLPLVFGVARRITRDGGLAEDIAQTVFLLLARKANQAARESVLSGWLFRTTRFVSLRALRSEQRRKNRERIAITMSVEDSADALWQQVTPELDEALAKLNETDRRALLLRFFEGHTLARVGETLGLSEEAAKKRVSRALDKLRGLLERRGVQVSAAALAAGLTREAAASVPAHLVHKIAAAEGGWLLTEMLRALQLGRLKLATAMVSGAVAVFLLFQTSQPSTQSAPPTAATTTTTTTVAKAGGASKALADSVEVDGVRIPLATVRVVVLDREDDKPIPGAIVKHMMGGLDTGLVTDGDGAVVFQVPKTYPEAREMNQFQAYVRAQGYAQRGIMWLSSTGGVTAIMGPEYTVRLDRGVTVGGVVVGEDGKPLTDVKVAAQGSGYTGYSYSMDERGRMTTPPVVRAQDYAEISTPKEEEARTDREGRFKIDNYPADLKSVAFEFETRDGVTHNFLTEEGDRLTLENLPRVSTKELKAHAARFVLARGIDVDGLVVNARGEPIAGAEVIESVGTANLKVLSRNTTDSQGRFRLTNRKPREVMLAATAAGHGSVSRLVTISKDMDAVRIELPAQTPLLGRVVDVEGRPIAGAAVGLVDYLNDGLGLQWGDTTRPDGRFVWEGAPTNLLTLRISAQGFASRVAKLKPQAEEHVLVLKTGSLDRVEIRGQVTDEQSGAVVEKFEARVHSIANRDGTPGYLRKTAQGSGGKFAAQLDLAALEIPQHDEMTVIVEAPGYQPAMSERFHVAEGDRDITMKLRRGGMIVGRVVTPEGEPAGRARLAIGSKRERAFLRQKANLQGKTFLDCDADGQFQVAQPLAATSCVFAHKSGWAVTALPEGDAPMVVRLQPWASVQVVLPADLAAREGALVTMNSFNYAWNQPLHVLMSESPKGATTIEFPQLPAGEFTAGYVPFVKPEMSYLFTMQTNFSLAAGERRVIELRSQGAEVSVGVKVPTGLLKANTAFIATLSRDVARPVKRGPEYYATSRSYDDASRAYMDDPALIAVIREERVWSGEFDGKGVRFAGVPQGRYVLEMKLLSGDMPSSPSREPATIAYARRTFEISSADAQDLGLIELEAK